MDFKNKSGKLNNSFTRFGGFTWGEHPKLRSKLEELSRTLQRAQGIRFSVKKVGNST